MADDLPLGQSRHESPAPGHDHSGDQRPDQVDHWTRHHRGLVLVMIALAAVLVGDGLRDRAAIGRLS